MSKRKEYLFENKKILLKAERIIVTLVYVHPSVPVRNFGSRQNPILYVFLIYRSSSDLILPNGIITKYTKCATKDFKALYLQNKYVECLHSRLLRVIHHLPLFQVLSLQLPLLKCGLLDVCRY